MIEHIEIDGCPYEGSVRLFKGLPCFDLVENLEEKRAKEELFWSL